MSQRLVKACQVPAPSTLDAHLPKQLDAIVLKSLAKRREDRFEDANALRLALEEYALESTVPASSAHLSGFMQKIYAEKIAELKDPSKLDELPPDTEIEGFGRSGMATPAPQSQRSRKSAVKVGGAAAADVTAQARTDRVEPGRSGSGAFIAVAVIALLGVAGAGVWY